MKRFYVLMALLLCFLMGKAQSVDIPLDRTGWTVTADSWAYELNPDNILGTAPAILDNDPNTYWVSNWGQREGWCEGEKYKFPQTLTINMGKVVSFSKFSFLPRQNDPSTLLVDYSFAVSQDGTTWEPLITAGAAEPTTDLKVVDLGKTVDAKFVQFVSNKSHGGQVAAMAEFNLIRSVPQDELVKVTYSYQLDGKEIATKVEYYETGAELRAPVLENSFLVTVQPVVGVADVEKTVPVELRVQNLPFVISESVENAHWYMVKLSRGSIYMSTDLNVPCHHVLSNEELNKVKTEKNAKYAWCFIGDPYNGFKIVNGATQDALANTPFTVSYVEPGQEVKWKLVRDIQNEDYFSVDDKLYISGRRVGCSDYTAIWYGIQNFLSSLTFLPMEGIALNDQAEIQEFAQRMQPVAGCVGAFSQENLDEVAKMTSYHEAHFALKPIKLKDGGYYRFQNVRNNPSLTEPDPHFNISSTLINRTDSKVSCESAELTDAGAIFALHQEGDEYKFKNLNTGTYLTHDMGIDPRFNVTDDVNVALPFRFSMYPYTDACFSIHNERFMHVDSYYVQFSNLNNGVFNELWHIIPATELEVKMTQVGDHAYSSLYVPFAVELPTGVSAYTAELNEQGNALVMHGTGKQVPEGTAMVLKGQPDVATVSMKVVDTPVEPLQGKNDLKGTYVPAGMVDMASERTWVLGDGGAKGIGFYHFTGQELARNKAFYQSDMVLTNGLLLDFGAGETTGVESVETAVPTMGIKVYDLTGRRVERMSKGLYIVNGKKVFVK